MDGSLSPGPRRWGFFAAGSNGALAEALTRPDLDPAGDGPPRHCGLSPGSAKRRGNFHADKRNR